MHDVSITYTALNDARRAADGLLDAAGGKADPGAAFVHDSLMKRIDNFDAMIDQNHSVGRDTRNICEHLMNIASGIRAFQEKLS